MYYPNPIIWLISEIIDIFSFVLFVWVILSILIQLQIVNRNQPLVYKIFDVLGRFVEPLLKPIRKYMPDLGGIDISPIVLVLLLQFFQRCLIYYF